MWLPSSSAWLIPQSMPPISWLRASSGLSTRPGANAPTSRRTRTSPSSGSTATSANCAPKVSSPCGVSSGGGRQLPIASASDMWLRASSSPYVSPSSGRSDAVRRPFATVTDGRGSAPCSGESSSPTASAMSCSRSAVPAACTAELTMPAPAEPTAAVLLGRSVSPAWKSTSRERDAERVGADLGAHGEHAGAELLRRGLHDRAAVGVGCGPARAARGMKNAIGYAAAAMPVPISQSPSRGRARRRVALGPAEALGAQAQALRQPVAGPRVAERVDGRVVAQPQLDRVDAAAGRRARPSPSRARRRRATRPGRG